MIPRSQHDALLILLLTLTLGGVLAVAAVSTGSVDPGALSRYLLWCVMGIAAIAIFVAPHTKTRVDNTIASYLLVIAIGGAVATYLIDHGCIAGFLLLGGIGVMAILLFFFWREKARPLIKG